MALIDREKLLKQLGVSERFNADIPPYIIGVIKGMPDLTNKGEWVSTEEQYSDGTWYVRTVCSNCGWQVPANKESNYCPYCGAEMR